MLPPVDYRAHPILVVDDEDAIVKTFLFNYKRDFEIRGTTSALEALAIIEHEDVAILVTDQRMAEMDGVELIRRALEIKPTLIPIILTGFTDAGAMIEALNLGRIYRYVAKPWNRDELRGTLCRAIETYHLAHENLRLAEANGRLLAELELRNRELGRENRYLKQQATAGGFEAVLGESPALRAVLDRARKVAVTDSTVLIEGPTGTGKGLLARAIHAASRRARRLLVEVDMGTLTETLVGSTLFGHRRGAFTDARTDKEGLFETASGGSIFLDEIGEMSAATQVQLLRVLQEGEILPLGATKPVKVDVRVIAATNRDLQKEVAAGRFREDLYHRLRVFPLRLPPLAERQEDIPLLAAHIVARLSGRLGKRIAGIEPEAMVALQRHRFPGNIRELENKLEEAMILADPDGVITEQDLFDRLPEADAPAIAADRDEPGAPTLKAAVLRFERQRIQDVVAACDGVKSQAASRLGLTYHGLLKKMRRCGLAVGE